MTATSIIQGLVSGCTAAYLKEPEKKYQCTRISLQANHALLLVAETLHFTNFPLGAFGTAVKVFCALTPFAVAADRLSGKQFLTEKQMENLSVAYQTMVAVSSVATMALGNPIFGIVSLSILAIDALVGNENELMYVAKRVGSFLALISYGTQAMIHAAATECAIAGMNVISALVTGIDSLYKIEISEDSKDSRPKESRNHYHFHNCSCRSNPFPAKELIDIITTLCRSSVWEKKS